MIFHGFDPGFARFPDRAETGPAGPELAEPGVDTALAPPEGRLWPLVLCALLWLSTAAGLAAWLWSGG